VSVVLRVTGTLCSVPWVFELVREGHAGLLLAMAAGAVDHPEAIVRSASIVALRDLLRHGAGREWFLETVDWLAVLAVAFNHPSSHV